MYALAVTPPFCDTSPPYENCGWNVAVPAIYFVSFFFMTSVTFVSLLTAVILKAFEDSKQLSTGTQRRVHSLTLDEAEAYSRFWSSMVSDKCRGPSLRSCGHPLLIYCIGPDELLVVI